MAAAAARVGPAYLITTEFAGWCVRVCGWDRRVRNCGGAMKRKEHVHLTQQNLRAGGEEVVRGWRRGGTVYDGGERCGCGWRCWGWVAMW